MLSDWEEGQAWSTIYISIEHLLVEGGASMHDAAN